MISWPPATSNRAVASRTATADTGVLVQLHSATLGGTQINAVDLAYAVQQHGFRSTITAPIDSLPDGPSLLDHAAERGLRIELRERGSSTLRAAKTLERLAQDGDASIVHVYGSWHARSAYCGPALLGRRALVHTIYEMEVPGESYEHLELIVGTGYLIDDLASRPGPVTLISPPVDTERDAPAVAAGSAAWRADHQNASGSPLMVMVTRLDSDMKEVSVRLAISALARMQARATLVIVGTGDAEARLRALGEETNRALGREAVAFAGPMSDPRAAYAAADIALGMGGSAARALAFGLPLVVVGEGERSELFEPRRAAALFRNSFWHPASESEPDAAAALAATLDRLSRSPGQRAELGAFGRAFAEENFGLDAMAERLAVVYERALRGYGARAWMRDAHREARALLRLPIPGQDPNAGWGTPTAYRPYSRRDRARAST